MGVEELPQRVQAVTWSIDVAQAQRQRWLRLEGVETHLASHVDSVS